MCQNGRQGKKNTSHLEMEEVGVAKEKENGPTNQISLPFNSNLVAKQQVVFFGSPLLLSATTSTPPSPVFPIKYRQRGGYANPSSYGVVRKEKILRDQRDEKKKKQKEIYHVK